MLGQRCCHSKRKRKGVPDASERPESDYAHHQTKMIELIIFVCILAEVSWDCYHEIVKHKSPNYTGSNILRGAVLVLIFIAAPWIKKDLTIDQRVSIIPMAMLCFWFLFDWGHNLVLTYFGHQRPYWYLGDNSRLDKWQRANGGAFRWFWIKLTLAVVSIVVFEVGFIKISQYLLNCFN